tara:strand:- start:187 stop:1125 length:939 start_codon:yes stop_codon:yes gene_type:complete
LQKLFNSVKIFTVCKPEIGSGHLIRSLLIKDALKPLVDNVSILGEFNNVPKHITNIQNINFKDLRDFDFSNDDFIIIDTYIGRKYFNEIDVKKFLIHDSGVDENIVESTKIDFNLTSDGQLDSVENIQGYKYFPISYTSRPEFKSKNIATDISSKKVLISLGGVSDESLVDIKKISDSIYKNNYEIYIADPSKSLSKRRDLKNYQFIHGKYLSEILNDQLFKFAIVGGGISKFVTISSGLPCIYIPRNNLESIHLQNIEKFNLGYVLNNKKNIDQGVNYIEERHQEVSRKSWLEIDGQGQERLQKAIIDRLN